MPGIRVISRAAAILRALMNVRSGLSLTQIAERVELPRATVQRIVNALVEERLVASSGSRGGYRLGLELETLSRSVNPEITRIARPHLLAISRATGETVDFSILRGHKVLFLDQVVGAHRLRTVSAVGNVFPLTNTANGKSCLSLLDSSQAHDLIRKEVRGEKLIKSIVAELIDIKRTGVAFNYEEHTIGICAIGVGFRDASGGIFSISVPLSTARFHGHKDNIIRCLQARRRDIISAIHAEQFNPAVCPAPPAAAG